MTETTEEKDLIAAIERCIEGDLGPAYDLSNGLHMSPGEAAAFHKWLNDEFDKLETQVSSLTKEIDDLKGNNKSTEVLYEEWVSEQIEKLTLKSQLSNREKEIEELKQNFDKTEFFYFVEDEEQLGSPNDVAEYWDCPIGGTLDIQSCKVFFQPTQTYIRTEKGMVPVQSKEEEEK